MLHAPVCYTRHRLAFNVHEMKYHLATCLIIQHPHHPPGQYINIYIYTFTSRSVSFERQLARRHRCAQDAKRRDSCRSSHNIWRYPILIATRHLPPYAQLVSSSQSSE